MSRLPLAVMTAALVVGCNLIPASVDCGPLNDAECRAAQRELEEDLLPQYPGRRIVEIKFLDEEGHVQIRLDDGTEIGVGERLSS